MNLPEIIELNGQRVLTTKQIAEAYGVDSIIVTNNFSRNRARYIDGKHVIKLEGKELQEFKTTHQIDVQLKHARLIYLWTEKGALLHAKSINTDKAWEVYEYLVDFYFRVKPQVQPKSPTRLVVDIPVNEQAQKMIAELRKDLTTIDTLLNLYNRYQTEEDYEKIVFTLRAVGLQIGNNVIDIARCRPQLISKVF